MSQDSWEYRSACALGEFLTLVQTGKVQPCPLVLAGHDYWSGLYNWLVKETAGRSYTDPRDLDLV